MLEDIGDLEEDESNLFVYEGFMVCFGFNFVFEKDMLKI